MPVLDKILTSIYLKQHKDIYVVEAFELNAEPNDSYKFNILLLRYEKVAINVLEKYEAVTENKLKTFLTGSIPVILVINTSKIINKVFNENDINESISLHQRIVGNVDRGDFYFQDVDLPGQKIISVARRKYIDSLMTVLSFLEARIIYICLGPYAIFYTYKTLLGNDRKDISFNNYVVRFEADAIKEISVLKDFQRTEDREINVGHTSISPGLYLPYSFGIVYYLQPYAIAAIEHKTSFKNKERIFSNAIGKGFLVVAATIILLLLVVNVGVFTVYRNKYNTLEARNTYQKTVLSERATRYAEFQKLEHIVKECGLNKASETIYFSEMITRNMPAQIYLNKMIIHPLVRAGNDEQSFDRSKIVIHGNCYSSHELNDWIEILKRNSWIKAIKIDEFSQVNADAIGSFKIEISK